MGIHSDNIFVMTLRIKRTEYYHFYYNHTMPAERIMSCVRQRDRQNDIDCWTICKKMFGFTRDLGSVH